MSPLKIIAILNLHVLVNPLAKGDISPAMREAFADFTSQGLLVDGVSIEALSIGAAPYPRLTDKGRDLVRRLGEVAP